MRIVSFIKEGHQMLPIEVELSLSPGLPRVEFTGMADLAIKESVTRLKTAFQHQNFVWPSKKQITINLRPAYIKKNSQGLDLAIACALLKKTKQLEGDLPQWIYGEVGLMGEVSAPEDWLQIDGSFLTGRVPQDESLEDLYCVENLRQLTSPQRLKSKSVRDLIERPALPKTHFSKNAALLLAMAGAGEHSVLLAGEAGSGKTTLAQHILCLLDEPSKESFKSSLRIARHFGKPLHWRPFVSPHHSTPPLSMIGGGSPPFLGEISRAHGGLLFLDEYLEFSPQVQEALREPMEKGEIFISRKGESVRFPARFILIAATNLCPCGSYIPGNQPPCAYSLRRCRSKLEKLSGPMLDRFDIMMLSSFWRGPLEVSMKEIQDKVKTARLQRKKRSQKTPNSRLSLEELEASIDPFILKNLMPSALSSKRRHMALLKTGRTLADLEGEEKVTAQHIEKASLFSLKPFNDLKLLA